MLDCGKVTDTVYKRSVRKVIERKVTGAKSQSDGIRDISHFESKTGHQIAAATAVLSGDYLAAAGTVHLAVNRLAAAGSRAMAVNIQLIVPEDLPEKSIKELVGAAAESCEKLQIPSVQADAAAAAGMKEPVITVMASGEAGSIFEAEKACADQDIIMAGYTGGFGAARLTFAHEAELEKHFNPVFLSPILEADYTGEAVSAVKAVETAAAAGVRTMYACGEGGVYSAVWELAETAGLGARIQLKEVPLKQETVEVCDYFNISPYQLLSAGAVLMTATHGQKVLAELAAAGIPAVIIGHLTDDNDRVVLNEEEMRLLEPFRQDSLSQSQAVKQV